MSLFKMVIFHSFLYVYQRGIVLDPPIFTSNPCEFQSFLGLVHQKLKNISNR